MNIDAWSIALIATKFVIFASTFLAVGTTLIQLALNLESELRSKKQTIVLLSVAILTSVLFLFLSTGLLYDDGILGMFDYTIFEIVSDSAIGQSAYLRIFGLCLLLICICLRGSLMATTAVIASLVICYSFTKVGHLSGTTPVYLHLLLTLHLIAVSFWIGAFIPLYKAASGIVSLKRTAELSHKFGQLAAYIVAVLLIAGIVMSVNLVDHPGQLISTGYGRVLLLKTMLVTVLLGIAAFNKLRIVPRLLGGQQKYAQHLQIAIRVEMALVAIILIITAILTTSISLPGHH